VADVCAGTGGKTLAMAAAMENTGEILCLDTSRTRLKELERRARRAGCSIAGTVAVHDHGTRRLPRAVEGWRGQADVVLADVPCSGSGTWRRIPDGPDHLAEDDLPRLAAKQLDILDRYSILARPGGRLVYATCSLFSEENQDVVAAWLKRNPAFRPVPVADVLQTDSSAIQGDWMVLTPDMHDTDGYFGAVLERRAD
jgi:16S rRNA (cytosine967-C5)-methyltransferase